MVPRLKRDITNGSRILRLSEPQSGSCLEKRLEPGSSVRRQKERWTQLFEARMTITLFRLCQRLPRCSPASWVALF